MTKPYSLENVFFHPSGSTAALHTTTVLGKISCCMWPIGLLLAGKNFLIANSDVSRTWINI